MKVLAVLDRRGTETIVEFKQPPAQFDLPAGEYRLYFIGSAPISNPGESGCDQLVLAHPISVGFVVNGQDNYTASVAQAGVEVVTLPRAPAPSAAASN